MRSISDKALRDPYTELREAAEIAVRRHGLFSTVHEVYGVLSEEVAEFFEEVREQSPANLLLRGELMDIAAVCMKAIEQIDDHTLPREKK